MTNLGRLAVLLLAVIFACVASGQNFITEKDVKNIQQRANDYKQGKLRAEKPDPAQLKQLDIVVHASLADLFTPQPALGSKCGTLKKIACSAAIAAAVAACGGPEDLPCIAAALGAMSTCISCLCVIVHCDATGAETSTPHAAAHSEIRSPQCGSGREICDTSGVRD